MPDVNRLVLAIVIAALAAPSAALPQFTLKVGVDLVNVLFTVTDRKGRLVSDLTRTDFAIEEDGRKQDIVHFATVNETALTIAMLIDISPSVRAVFDEEKETAIGFLSTVLRPNDLAAVIAFEKSVTLVSDFTDRRSTLEKAIRQLEPGPERDGGTSLYDAIYLAAREQLAAEAGRKVIILISDGEDTTSKVKFFEALLAAHRSDIVIYSISNTAASHHHGQRRFGYGDPDTLKKFSEETGGGYYFLDRRNSFQTIFEQIANELRAQYSLSYYSTNTQKDGKFRKIRIIPRDATYSVRARKGYYAPRETSEK